MAGGGLVFYDTLADEVLNASYTIYECERGFEDTREFYTGDGGVVTAMTMMMGDLYW